MTDSSFAQRELTKRGWKKGQGLGKDKAGISEAIKVNIKTDTTGVGHDPGAEFSHHWWDDVYNQATKNITVTDTEDGVAVTCNNADKNQQIKTPFGSTPMLYSQFIKGATLHDAALGQVEAENDDTSDDDSDDNQATTRSTEEEVFRRCGGRTAHKAARHGLKLSGKLRRVEEQDKTLAMQTHTSKKKKILKGHTKEIYVANDSSPDTSKSCKRWNRKKNCST